MTIVEISEVSLAEMDSERSWGRYVDLPKPGSRTGGHDGIEMKVGRWVVAPLLRPSQ